MKRIKAVLLGNINTGKSCLVHHFIMQNFDETSSATIGTAFTCKNLEKDNKVLCLDLWDTAGAERFRAFAPLYYRDAQIIFLCYDVTEKPTFDAIKNYWLPEIIKNCNTKNPQIYLLGNKCDLEEHREVDKYTANNLLKEDLGFDNIYFFETSAKEGKNIEELLEHIFYKNIESTSKPKKNIVLQLESSSSYWTYINPYSYCI
jgi:small GTP-binding protein